MCMHVRGTSVIFAGVACIVAHMFAISGSRGGFWFHVGHHIDGDPPDNAMHAEYVPCNAEGEPVCVSRNRKGYWCFHLPGVSTTVYFHRQLMRDLRGGIPLGNQYEVHHVDFSPNNNMTHNLDAGSISRKPNGMNYSYTMYLFTCFLILKGVPWKS